MNAASPAEERAREVCIVFLMFFILLGNTLVIVAYKTNRRLHTASNVFIVGLATSDWLVGTVALPLYLVILRRGEPSLMLNRLYISLDIFSGTASVFHLVSFTVERYIAVSKPFFHHSLLLGVYYYPLSAVWVLSLVLSCLNFALAPNVARNYPLWVLVTVFVFALFVIPLINVRVFKITKTLFHNSVGPAGRDIGRHVGDYQRNIQREGRMAVTLATMSGIFFIAWLPHVIGALVFTHCFPCSMTPIGIARLGAFIKWMQYANSAVNPFVFAFRDAETRKTIKRFLQAC